MKKYYKKDIEKVVDDIIEQKETFKNWKVESVYIYENGDELVGFVHFTGQGLLQFIYDDLKANNENHQNNWKDVTNIFKSDEPFSKKWAVDVLFEELN